MIRTISGLKHYYARGATTMPLVNFSGFFLERQLRPEFLQIEHRCRCMMAETSQMASLASSMHSKFLRPAHALCRMYTEQRHVNIVFNVLLATDGYGATVLLRNKTRDLTCITLQISRLVGLQVTGSRKQDQVTGFSS